MKAVYCPYCGGRTKRNGRTSSGSQRWRCTACGASTTVRYDDTATRLDEFLGWLLSKDSQAAMPGGGRSFRRRTAEFWEVWPMPVPDGELHRVLYVDGIWVARDLVVLICCSGERVVSWYMARSENSGAWSALMAPIPAPEVVVTDGGSGFAKAVRETWPRTRVQRCTFHAFSQVKRYTTTRPKLQAGRELYLIARDLMGIETLHQAELWVERYLDWCGFWADFLEDRTVVDGRRVYTHERLRRARGLATLMWTVPGGAQETGGPYMRDPRHPRHFTDEFKRQIVDLYNAGKPKREIMDEYDLGKSTVERWIKSINATGSPRAADNRTPEQNRILELERENRRLRMEVDVLKQAALIYARK